MKSNIYDSYGRKINYLRISLTDRCNLRCSYCMPPEGIEKKSHGEIMRLEEIVEIAKAFTDIGIEKIRLTGGEPMVRKDIEDIIKGISEIAKPKDLAMTTNGTLLKGRLESLRANGLMRLNISLDTLDAAKYTAITRDPLGVQGTTPKDIVQRIEEALELGYKGVKINTVLIGGFNDNEINGFVELATRLPIDVRFIELMPIGLAATWSKTNYVSIQKVLDTAAHLKPIETPDKSSPARYFSAPGMKGRIGLINPVSCSFCENCNRIRITPDGKLKTCLHGEEEYEILKVFREKGILEMQDMIRDSVSMKPEKHEMDSDMFKPISRSMYRIGG